MPLVVPGTTTATSSLSQSGTSVICGLLKSLPCQSCSCLTRDILGRELCWQITWSDDDKIDLLMQHRHYSYLILGVSHISFLMCILDTGHKETLPRVQWCHLNRNKLKNHRRRADQAVEKWWHQLEFCSSYYKYNTGWCCLLSGRVNNDHQLRQQRFVSKSDESLRISRSDVIFIGFSGSRCF